MVIKTNEIKELCSKILAAVDSSELSILADKLQLYTKDDTLYLAVSNNKYFVKVKFILPGKENFNATLKASLFLKLISQTTSEIIDLSIADSFMVVKGNGTYKLPLVYDNDKLLELPEIVINNKTSEFDIETSILNSILVFNTKELNKGAVNKQVQMMYYVDEEGAITFTSGACVNKFTLPCPIKILFDQQVVKLFKIFKGEKVKFAIGYDALSEELVQTKVSFEDDTTTLTAILSSNDNLINSVPVTAIRNRAYKDYAYSISINREELLQAINRIMLFTTTGLTAYGKFTFGDEAVSIADSRDANEEIIKYSSASNIVDPYEARLDLKDVKLTLENCTEQNITMNFGDKAAFVISRGNIYNVIPEAIMQ